MHDLSTVVDGYKNVINLNNQIPYKIKQVITKLKLNIISYKTIHLSRQFYHRIVRRRLCFRPRRPQRRYMDSGGVALNFDNLIAMQGVLLLLVITEVKLQIPTVWWPYYSLWLLFIG